MIDYFSGWQNEGGYCFQIESIEVMNPNISQCNELIIELEAMCWELIKRRDELEDM